MENLIHKNDIAAQRQVVADYYETIHELRDNNPDLSAVYGTPYMYRPDGTALDDTSVQFAVWNMRRAPPPLTIDTPQGLIQIAGQIGDPPCEFPDLGDMVVVDCTVDQLFQPLVDAVPENWRSSLNKKLYTNPIGMLAAAVNNVCRGDLVWEMRKADEDMRKSNNWDQHDLPGNPWVRFAGRVLLVKTQRLQANARAEMLMTQHTSVPLFEGNPAGPGATEVGVFHYGT